MKTILLLPVIVLLGLSMAPLSLCGQDPNYTQWLNAPVYYNPAFTGLNLGLRARFSYREQWPALPVDFKTMYFSADWGDRNLPGAGGLGIMINSDNEGIGFIKNFSAGLSLSVRIPLSPFMISQIGVKASVMQKSINWNDFVFSDQLNETYGNIYNTALPPPDSQQRIFADFSVGGLVQFVNSSGNFAGTAGFAVDHLFQPDESFLANSKSPLPRKYIGHLDFVIAVGRTSSPTLTTNRGFGDPLKINPGILYQNQNGKNSLQAGMNMLKYNIYLGGYFYTTNNYKGATSLDIIAGYRYIFADDMSLKFMYSYDIQLAGNLAGTGGAHEITLILEFSKIRLFGKDRYEQCPSERQHYLRLSPLECSPF
jgi:type IX secretion system PorP/SprF family membrane protein